MTVIEHCGGCGHLVEIIEAQRDEARRHKDAYLAMREENGIIRNQLRGAVKALVVARSTMRRSMASDESCDHPFNEDMADALKLIDAALGGR